MRKLIYFALIPLALAVRREACSASPKKSVALKFLLILLTLSISQNIFAQAPVINSFSPASGPAGTSVTITGTGFGPAAANNVVFFGATMAKVTAASATSLTVTVPVGATYQPISVLNGITALTGYSGAPFVTTFTPNKGSITGGDFAPRVTFTVGKESNAIAICDLDGDGKPDIVAGNDNGISIFRNTSTSGSITASSFAPKVDFATGGPPGNIAIADLDGDGKPDIVVQNYSVNKMSVLRNTSTIGSITSNSFAPSFDIVGIRNSINFAISDIDGDGRPDLVVTSDTDGIAVSIWQNISTVGTLSANSFAPRVDISSPHFSGAFVAVSDIDGDGKPDVVLTDYDVTPFVVQYNRDSVFVLRNTSTTGTFNHANFSFAAPVSFATGTTPRYVFAIGDLDGDGKPDLAVPNEYGNSVSVLRNTSTIGSITASSFAPHVDFATSLNPIRVAISDLDGDGKPDLVILTTDTAFKTPPGDHNALSVLRNTSVTGSITTSSFAPKVDFAIGIVSYGLAIGDLDGDGKPDLAAFNTNIYSDPSAVSVLRNNPIYPPTIQATNVTFSGIAASFAKASWTNGNGSSRAVFMAETSTGSPLPVNNVTYTANPAFGSGTQIGTSSWYCIYNGTGDTVKITGLKLGSTYRVMVLEYNGVAGYEDYLTSTATGNPANVTTRPGSNSALSNLTTSSGELDPGFASVITSYATTVNSTTSTLVVTPTPFDPDATVTVNGGSPSTPVNLVAGPNTITVKVTSQDSTSTTTYTIGVYRLPDTGPNITYGTATASVKAGVPVSLHLTNTGGPVDAAAYGQVTTIAGSTTDASGDVDTTGTSALFNWPQAMVKDASGNLYITDSNNNAVRILGPSGTVSTFAGSATGQAGNADGPGTSALFSFPDGIAIDAAGNLFVADYNNNAIRKITPGGVVTTFYSSTGIFGPGGICFDSSGNLIVTAQDASQILKITPAGIVTTIAGNTPGYANGTGTAALFNTSSDVRADTSGNLYVTDFLNNAIRKITPAGVVTTFAGSDVSGNTAGYADGVGTAAVFNNPTGLAIGPGRVIYVADIYNNDIRKIMPDGTVTLVAGSTAQAPGYMDGKGTAVRFNLPANMYIDDNGIGYISEIGGNRVRQIMLTGYTINGTLPPGLTFDSTTGNISGTVTGPFSTRTDTVSAYNGAGHSSTIISFSYYVPSTIATLSNLTTSSGTLNPIFASATTNYTDLVTNATSSIAVTPTTTDTTATVTVNGTTVISGAASALIPLAVGPNTITTVVTAQDGITTDTYTVTVTRAALSTIATLSNLTISNGTLTPAFNSATTSYTASVPNSVIGIAVTPTFTDPNATITVNGTPVVSGAASGNILLAVGPNTITTAVTAQDGTTTDTYTVVVTRAPSSVATLANLIISQETLTPAFDSTTTSYTASVPNSVTGITETPIFTDPNATIMVNGTAVTSGTASGNIPLAVGPNTITTMVTAQDGTTTDTYTVVVTRAASSDALLTDLTVSQGKLTPSFSSGTTAYADSVSTLVTSITVTPTTSDNTATVTVNGTVVSSGTASNAIPLMPGDNTITVVVTAQDGVMTDTYTLTVYRGDLLSNLDATNVLTPNGDGKNDYWTIKDIQLYPQNNVNIFDKAGRLVYSKRGYSNDWDGTLNGSPLAEGTYYYTVDLGPALPKFKGFISILRN